MEVLAPQHLNETDQVKKRTQCPGIRVIGGRIYDSEKGVCCHQCRQKTRDFAASCKNLKGEKLCAIKFCLKCLLNRYGENAEEVDVLNDWKCPRCRGICNCSQCMKRRGHQPTGQLVRTAKASGFSSVSEMLNAEGPSNITSSNIQNVAVSPMKAVSSKKDLMIDLNISNSDMEVKSDAVQSKMPGRSDKELVLALSVKDGKENSIDRNSSLNSDSQKTLLDSKERPKKTKREGLKEIRNGSRVNDACQNGSPKRVKISNEVPFEETKQNATDDIIQAGKKRKMQQKVKVPRTSNDVSLNSDEKDVKKGMNKRSCKDIVNPENKEMNNVISLPLGSVLTGILDLEFPPEDVGHALQFLEYCTAFEKILDMKKGEAEAILEELICIQNAPRHKTLTVHFYIRLLTLILSESGDGSSSLKTCNGKHLWWKALRNIISESDIVPKELQLDDLQGVDGYYNLNLSIKLKLLNFLCDEALGTETIRSFINEQHSKFAEGAKEAKIKVAAAKEKERSLKLKMKHDVEKGSPLSISEYESLVREIKVEAARAHAKMLEAKGLVPKTQQRSDAVRTEPVLVDGCGRAFWRLKCFAAEYAVLLQEIKYRNDAAAADERWFVYGTEQKHDIEAYISSRAKRPKM